MKIAVLAIALNEVAFIERWASSALDANTIILVDTGSTDGTVEAAKEFGGIDVRTISVKPWRFDVARNAALALVPDDIDVVVNLDLDEVLLPGWREAVEEIIKTHPDTTRIHYDYIWSWKPDGSPGVRFNRDMIHVRHGYMWKHPCHESLYYTGPGDEKIVTTDAIRVEHHPDSSKSRGQYMNLLQLAVKEDPTNDRMAHYYARELFFHQRWSEAIDALVSHLDLETAVWDAERAQSMIYISKCHEALYQPDEAMKWATAAYLTSPLTREPLTQIASLAYQRSDWHQCLAMVDAAVAITNQSRSYMNDPQSWGSFLYDIGYIAAYHLNKLDIAEEMITTALTYEPDNPRLINNRDELARKRNSEDNTGSN